MSQFSHLYKTAAWQQRRREQLRRFPLCCFCERAGLITAASVADHIQPHRGDLKLFAGPLQSLCPTCHSGRKQQLEKSGHVRGCDEAGLPLDPRHHWNRAGAREAGAHADPSAQARSAVLARPSEPQARPCHPSPGGGAETAETAGAQDRPSTFLCSGVNRNQKGSA